MSIARSEARHIVRISLRSSRRGSRASVHRGPANSTALDLARRTSCSISPLSKPRSPAPSSPASSISPASPIPPTPTPWPPRAAGAPHGSVYFADEQLAGRGRGDHAWHSAAGEGLYVSVLLRPQSPPRACRCCLLPPGSPPPRPSARLRPQRRSALAQRPAHRPAQDSAAFLSSRRSNPAAVAYAVVRHRHQRASARFPRGPVHARNFARSGSRPPHSAPAPAARAAKIAGAGSCSLARSSTRQNNPHARRTRPQHGSAAAVSKYTARKPAPASQPASTRTDFCWSHRNRARHRANRRPSRCRRAL